MSEPERAKAQVRVYHYRICVDQDGATLLAHPKQIKEQELTMLNKGGMTEVLIVNPETEEVLAEGTAVCNTLDDYNKRLGRSIALGRALLPQNERLRRAVPVEERTGVTAVTLSGTAGVTT